MDAPKWEKPSEDRLFHDGEKLLLAVFTLDSRKVSADTNENGAYEYYIVRVSCDVESPVEFIHDETNEAFYAWAWDDIDWFIKICD
jgi:hypothetical protein